ncbi:MAG: tetratricopeptide repeat protein [Candidatus Latescibacteria bacterium]|nr:tetratricopeptide repeat protein [bacterium]MBD3424139.1 tetratricopeptide repeat protein [Candidatus Latescibacterota bacterium]
MIVKRRLIRKVSAAAAAVAMASLFSCVYFNTLYNARRIYDEAEYRRIEEERSLRSLESEYERVVVKCSKILKNHPDSRWADDAAFLLGKTFFRMEEYAKSEKKFKEIIENWPDDQYAPLSRYWLAKIYLAREEYQQALSYTEQFLELHPDHETRFEVLMTAGDIKLQQGRNEEALEYYLGIVEEAEEDDISEMAVLRAADMHYSLRQWEKAAGYYETVLRKGITWERQLEISLPLGRCYTELGRCQESIDIYNQLLEKVKQRREKAPIFLGMARGYECMDSLQRAIYYYEDLMGKFPKSTYSAEASYYLGNLYHQKTDSLQKAKEYFGRVAKEDPESEFATESLKRANSISRLIEFEDIEEGEATIEQKAMRNFYKAEIQLIQFDQVEKALSNYQGIVDSFPATEAAAKSAYAIAWIYEYKLDEPDSAIGAYTRVARNYPRRAQAAGALDRIESLGGEGAASRLQAYVDSVQAIPDSSISAEGRRMEESQHLPVQEPDSLKNVPALRDSAAVLPGDSTAAPADSAGGSGQ